MLGVAKCHGYDGLIRVKMLAGWGKSLESTKFCKIWAFLEQICTIYMRLLCLNFTHWQNHQHLFSKNIPIANFGHFWCQNGRNLGAFIRVIFGLKVLLRVKRLTFCNSAIAFSFVKMCAQKANELANIQRDLCILVLPAQLKDEDQIPNANANNAVYQD